MAQEIASLSVPGPPSMAGPPPPLNDRLREAAELLVDALLDHYLRQRRALRIAEQGVARDVPMKGAPSV